METMTLEAASAGQAAEDAKGGLDFSAQPDPSAKKTPFEIAELDGRSYCAYFKKQA